MEITIRPVRLEDIPSIHSIYYQSVVSDTASWELEPPDQAEMQRRCEALLAKSFPYFVAVIHDQTAGKQVIGYCYASNYRERAGYRFTVENSIYVDSRYQRLGVGAKLLAALIDACTTKNFRQMIAVIGGSERQASIALHEKMGFQRVGVLRDVGFKHGRWLDVVLMQRTLGAGSTTMPVEQTTGVTAQNASPR